MHPELERELVRQRIEDLRRAGAPLKGRGRVRRAVAVGRDGEVVLRGVRSADRSAVTALATLDGTLPPVGPALAAEVDGSIAAVMPLGGGRPFGDPFRHTRDLIELLEERARQLEAARRAPRRRLRWRIPALRRRVA